MLLQECYHPADRFLAGHDLVLQAEESNGNALINVVMASTARHPFWLRVLELMEERVGSAHNVLYATGAKAFRITNAQSVLVMLQCGGFSLGDWLVSKWTASASFYGRPSC